MTAKDFCGRRCEREWSRTTALGGFHRREASRTGASELREALKDCEGLIVRSETKVTAELLDAASSLRVIGRAGVGVDNIDVSAATIRGIVVMNAPDGNTITTAEHTIALLISLARSIPQASSSLKAGRWDRKKFIGVELQGKTLGVVGLGRIGRVVASRARAMGMTSSPTIHLSRLNMRVISRSKWRRSTKSSRAPTF